MTTQENIWEQKLLGTSLFTPKALIKHVGRTPAALLQQLHYSLQNSNFTQYGDRWVSRTLESWAEILECCTKTVQRAFDRLESMGLVLSSRFHSHAYNQRKSYRVDYEVLQTLLENETKCLERPRHNVSFDVDTLSRSNNKILNTGLKKQQTEDASFSDLESIPSHHPVSKIDKKVMVVDPEISCKGFQESSLDESQVSGREEVEVEAEIGVEVKNEVELDPELEQEIVESVGHRLSSGLKMLVIQASSDVIQDALTILRNTKNVKNKAGLLRRAIEKGWKPSAAAKSEKKFTLDPDFDEWWGYAKQLGLVMGSELKDGEFWIYSAPKGTPQLYGEMRSMFSMSWLKKQLSW